MVFKTLCNLPYNGLFSDRLSPAIKNYLGTSKSPKKKNNNQLYKHIININIIYIIKMRTIYFFFLKYYNFYNVLHV